MTRLTLQGLRKSYVAAGHAAVRGLDLAVESGRLTALLGPSGCGKTTTMKLIAGLLAPDSGDILLDGRSIRALPPERRGVVMVFQNALLFPHLTVAENVGFGLKMRGLPPREIAARVEPLLTRVRLDGLGARNPAQLSGGQQQRAALARALVLQPAVLLLDEPLSSLDPSLRDEMRQLILSLQRETGITTLVVTHDQAEAVALADRIALMLAGQLAQEGTPEDIYRRPATLAVARFFGAENFVPGIARSGRFHCDLGELVLPAGLAEGPQTLTIRPEGIRLFVPPGADTAGGTNIRKARVAGVTFLGSQTRVTLGLGGITLQALTAPDAAAALQPGAEIDIALPPGALWLLPSE